jgi:hypothetical protein
MLVVVNLSAISNEERPAPVQATKEIEERYPDIARVGGFLSMLEYARELARQRQQGRLVATMATPPPPQPQHVARSQLFQGASSPGNLYT